MEAGFSKNFFSEEHRQRDASRVGEDESRRAKGEKSGRIGPQWELGGAVGRNGNCRGL
jgi:hypothetical protein